MASYPRPGLHHPPRPTSTLPQESPLLVLVRSANAGLRSHIVQGTLYETPLYKCSLPGTPYLKLESEQVTKSFKARGALNKIHHISTNGGYHGVVTASTGNHALAIAYATNVYKQPCTIFIPSNTTERKKNLLHNSGVEIIIKGDDCLSAELAARAYAEEKRLVYVSPYNDLHVAAGQGTIAYEILDKLDGEPRSVYVTVGGGGLIAGIASVLKPLGWRIVGCQPERSAVMLRCVEAGRVVDVEVGDTISDGSAGCLEQDCVTLTYCAELVDLWIVVPEEDIRKAVSMMKNEGVVIEGAAGVAVAGYMKDDERSGEGVIIICGGNVD